MDGLQLAVVALVVWIGIGLTTALWMARKGHRNPGWILVATCLGPALALAASERVQRVPGTLTSTPLGAERPSGLRVLVGLDGSAGSQAALALAVRLVGPNAGTVTAAEVVDYDAAEIEENVGAAQDRLNAAVDRAGGQVATTVVLSGPPSQALTRFSRERDIDIIIVGRHGRGLSKKLLGNVAQQLLRSAEMPVLVVSGSGAGSEQVHAQDG